MYYVYIISNTNHTTFYTGSTRDLKKRIWEHKEKFVDGFSKKYNCNELLYYESHESIYGSLQREKRIKKYPREWKINLINSMNPTWKDLFSEL